MRKLLSPKARGFWALAVDTVIHDFKQVPRKVKTNSNIFVVKSFHKHINNMGMENVPNVGFVNPMFKSGGDTDNLLLHTFILIQNAGRGKRETECGVSISIWGKTS